MKTISYKVRDAVATITLDRPDVLNAFNRTMCDEVSEAWSAAREDVEVHVAVIQAAGSRAFCTGVDRRDGIAQPENPWQRLDPGDFLGPKANGMYKPVICAVNGMCAGGAFYFVNEADIVICSTDATFFDPHVTYGMTSALEPAALARRIPLGEVMRWALLGLDERMSPERALQIGLVSEVVAPESLHTRAHDLAAKIASKPAVATEGTVRAVWGALEVSPRQARALAIHYPALGNEVGKSQIAGLFESGERPRWELR
jgi:enoyl-CoA hydratase/carnithine racemase